MVVVTQHEQICSNAMRTAPIDLEVLQWLLAALWAETLALDDTSNNWLWSRSSLKVLARQGQSNCPGPHSMQNVEAFFDDALPVSQDLHNVAPDAS